MVKKTTLIQKIKEIILKEWKSKSTVQDVIKKQLIEKKNKPFWLFFFIYGGNDKMIKKLILGTMQTNCYVVYNDLHECFIVDPGAQGQKIKRFLTENELDLKAILLTHGHFDHIGAVDYLYEQYHCPIYTKKESFEIIANPQYNLSAMMCEAFTLKSPIIEAEDTIQIAHMTVQWLLLEGHCYGSSMIYIPEENALLSGDVLFAGSIGRYDFPTSSHLTTKESLKKIKSLQFDARLLPGHGEESTLKYEQQHNPFLRS